MVLKGIVVTKVHDSSSNVSNNDVGFSNDHQKTANDLFKQACGNKASGNVVLFVFTLLGPPMGLVSINLITLPFLLDSISSEPLRLLNEWPLFFFFLFVESIFSYVFGLIPAFLTGCVFWMWYSRQTTLPKRLTMACAGFVFGGVVTLVCVLIYFLSFSGGAQLIFSVIGAGAGALSALWVHYFANKQFKKGGVS